MTAALPHIGSRLERPGLRVLIKLILIITIAAGAAFLVVSLFSRKQSEEMQPDKTKYRQPNSLLPFVILGITCVVIVIYVLPRFGITLTGLMQKFLALLPLIRALLPF